MAAPSQRQTHHLQVPGWSAGGSDEHSMCSCTMHQLSPRTKEQLQACSIRRELAWRLRHKGKHTK